MNKIVPMLLLLFTVLVTPALADNEVAESDIDLCTTDDECMVVAYGHCCGASKRAINREYLALYEQTPQWQTFNEPVCAVLGICQNDSKVTAAVCKPAGVDVKRCVLDWNYEAQPAASDPCE